MVGGGGGRWRLKVRGQCEVAGTALVRLRLSMDGTLNISHRSGPWFVATAMLRHPRRDARASQCQRRRWGRSPKGRLPCSEASAPAAPNWLAPSSWPPLPPPPPRRSPHPPPPRAPSRWPPQGVAEASRRVSWRGIGSPCPQQRPPSSAPPLGMSGLERRLARYRPRCSPRRDQRRRSPTRRRRRRHRALQSTRRNRPRRRWRS